MVSLNDDTFNNPTLSGLFYLLSERNIQVKLLCTHNNYKNTFQNIDVNIIQIEPCQGKNYFLRFCYKILYKLRYLHLCVNIIILYPNRIIGVDPAGIIQANKYFQSVKFFIRKFKMDYFSFEIFFTDEGALEKEDEIKACKNISNLIIQDSQREKLLRNENRIEDYVNSFYIPVSPVIFDEQNATVHDLRKEYNLSPDQKLLLQFGSFENWSGAKLIFNCLDKGFPDNWILVIHSRRPLDSYMLEKISSYNTKKLQVIISTVYLDSFQDAFNFIKQFDVGLAFYVADGGIFTGKNIFNIGFASGKFSMYVLAGLKIIASNLPFYKNLNEQFNFGYLIESAEDILKALDLINTAKEACSPPTELIKELNPVDNLAVYIDNLIAN